MALMAVVMADGGRGNGEPGCEEEVNAGVVMLVAFWY